MKKTSSDEEEEQLDKALAASGLLRKSHSYAGFADVNNGASNQNGSLNSKSFLCHSSVCFISSFLFVYNKTSL